MSLSLRMSSVWVVACALAAAASTTLCLAASPAEGAADSAPASPPTPATLLATYQRMSDKLAHNAFGRPMQLDSAETPDGLKGDVYAVVDHPIADVSATLKSASHWCELLLLHINNRRCQNTGAAAGAETLTLSVVRNYDQAPESAFELPFAYRVVHADADHLEVDLSAPSGPLGTSNYRVALEAVAIDERKTFVHFSYSYDHNMMARLATQAYLATFGSNKVGFTVVGKGSGGEAEYIRGTRGLVERNAMRYFLTLDAYLAERAAPAGQQFERRLRHWYNGSERYPLQLHEVDFETYLALKRDDRERATGK
ncbi:hypothetical protein BH11PSE13_BH11PSE13_45930 [soil metagenome]